MIKRDKYLNELIKVRGNGFPKVITGIRRCGKSYLLTDIYKEYLLQDGVEEGNILYIDLDRDENAQLRNPLALGQYARSLAKEKNGRVYIFLDEIQRVAAIKNPAFTGGRIILAKPDDEEIVSFVDVILGLSHEPNIDLYVTGSNSKMLSKDVVTQFRDKAINISLAPLSYEEYSGYAGGASYETLLGYLRYGGMPLAVLEKEDSRREKYLKSLFETTYYRDIIEHNKLERSESLDELCGIVSQCAGQLLNSEKIANTYKSRKKENISRPTVGKYISYFVDAFILSEASRYDLKGRKRIDALRKYYFSDTGLRNAKLNFAYEDEGQMLENVIYNELLYNGYSVSVGTFDEVAKEEGKSVRKNHEVDFYATKGNRRFYIQVADDISEENTRLRETRPLNLLKDNNVTKLIVINRPINESHTQDGLIVIGASDFMLRFIK